MKITIITLFPEMFASVFSSSILNRAQTDGKLTINLLNLRRFGIGKHSVVDDKPYGGGVGMVLRVDVVVAAIRDAQKEEPGGGFVILMDPKGSTYTQHLAEDLSEKKHLILICGHYEGFDERIRDYIDLEISIGDFVLSGGEIAAMAVVESVARLVPGILSKKEATQFESFSDIDGSRLLEHPHYTRPADFEGKTIPDVLTSGHKENIEKYRTEESLNQTKSRRPEILENQQQS